MAMIRCDANEHYFDETKHSKCPFCKGKSNAEKTVLMTSFPKERELTTIMEDDSKTVAPWQREAKEKTKEYNKAPIVGWLVIIEGNHKGEDFRIIHGINSIGRERSNTICLNIDDNEISRETHCIIEFDSKNSKFYLERGTTTTYLNDARVGRDGTLLKMNDIIEIGSTKLRFIPFCGEDFSWKI